jgi:predicted translin family RNA/ssDNA-binding protein
MSLPAKRKHTDAASESEEMIKSTTNSPLEVADFDNLIEELSTYDFKREEIIKRARDITKLSKQAIFSLHRSDFDQASQRLAAANKLSHDLLPTVNENPSLRPGTYSGGIEELVEAEALTIFLKEKRLITRKEVPLATAEEFLGGILDLCGEINRYSIARATVRDTQSVKEGRDLVEALMGQMLRFDLRNGAIRKKYDGLKYTLKRMEQTLYELSLTEAGLASKPTGDDYIEGPGVGGNEYDNGC